jgi:hypothetical protein
MPRRTAEMIEDWRRHGAIQAMQFEIILWTSENLQLRPVRLQCMDCPNHKLTKTPRQMAIG